MNNKVAFACPIYDSRNHFEYGVKLLESKVNYNINADLWFVFSDETQKNKFNRMVEEKNLVDDFLWLILPQSEGQYKSQVTIKKFYALRTLKDQYKYIATVDSETIFIKNINYEKEFDSIWAEKNFLKANKSPNGFFIMRNCYKTLGIISDKKLKKETGNYLYNIWFNEIPLYKCDILDEFFEWLDSLNQEYKNEWLCFEYYIFSAFLIIKKDFHMVRYNIESLGGIMEYLYVFPKEKQLSIVKMLKPHWTSTDETANELTGIRFHLDRSAEEENYGSKTFFEDIKKYKWKRHKQIIKDFLGLE